MIKSPTKSQAAIAGSRLARNSTTKTQKSNAATTLSNYGHSKSKSSKK